MLRALGDVLGPDDRVLVIDDNSPDGTGELADRLATELVAAVEVLHAPLSAEAVRPDLASDQHEVRRLVLDAAALVLGLPPAAVVPAPRTGLPEPVSAGESPVSPAGSTAGAVS